MKHRHPVPTALRPTRKLLSAALASCLVFAAAPGFAQSTAATIRGQVTVDSAPATDATVTATNLNTGLVRTVSATNGQYAVAGLPPGAYRLDVTSGGQTSTQNVTVAVGQVATLNLGLGGVAETAAAGDATNLDTVRVTAPALVETKTSEVATYVSAKQIEALPQGTRNFLAFAETVPGVQFIQNSDGSTALRSGAQNSNGVNVFLDGVGQKNYVLSGGVAGQDGSRGNPFPQSAIGEYKVITSNYKAEYDQLSSAAITAVTRSGTNEFHGDFFWDHTSTDWRSPTPAEDRSGNKAISKETQYGATFGGPILKDVAHFFVAYEAKEYNTPFSVTPGQGVTAAQLPANVQDLLGPTAAPFKEDLYFAKVDATFGDNSQHLVELTGKYRDEKEIIGVGDQNTQLFATAKQNDEKRADLRWQYSGDRWLNDMHVTYEEANYSPRPTVFGNGYVITRNDTLSEGANRVLNAGPGENYQDKGQKGYSFQNDTTFSGFTWQGNHTFKFGVKYKEIKVSALEQRLFNPQFFYDLNALDTPYRVQFASGLAGLSAGAVESENKQYGIYFQDDWEVNDKLTLNLGVRYDYEDSPLYENYQTPDDVLAALNAQDPHAGAPVGQTYAQTLALGGVDINKFISNGNNRSQFKDAFQPRLGFSYDINGDQSMVVYGGAGRSYDRNIFDNLQLETTKGTFPDYTYRFNTAAHPCAVGVGNCLAYSPDYMNKAALEALAAQNPNAGREVFLMQNDLKTPYSDQFSIGIRNLVTFAGQEWNTDIGLQRIVSKDGFAFLLGNRRPDGSFFAPGTQFGAPYGFGVPGFERSLLLGTNGLETRSNSLLLKIDKLYTSESGWGTTLAYTFSDAEENRQLGEFFSLDYPTLKGFGWNKSTGIPRHRLVATGIYDAPWGFTLSGKLTLASATYYYVNPNFSTSPGNGSDQAFISQYKPDTTFKQLDLAVSKQWDTGTDIKFNIRGDILNVTNERNYNQYDLYTGNLGNLNPNFGEHQDGIQLPTRTFKLSFGLNW